MRDRRHNIEAYLCVGEANLPQHVNRPQDSYCAYHAAALLARQAPELRSRAHIGRARALEALRASQVDIVAAYTEAHRANPSATDARVALARHYMTRGQFGDLRLAENVLVEPDPPVAGRLRAISPANADVALAIVELARKPDAQNKVQLLSAAAAVAPNSVAVNSALGAAYFDLEDRDRAHDYLQRAIAQGQVVEPGYENLQEQAYYYLSIIYVDRGGQESLRRARDYADRAGNEAQSLRQACLVRLMLGGESVFQATRDDRGRIVRPDHMRPSDDARRACVRLGSSPEGSLLEGMFWLRYSQYRGLEFNPAVGQPGHPLWRQAVDDAERAFEEGRRSLGDDNRTLLSWPGADRISGNTLGRQMTMRAMLGYGDDLADFFQSYCQGNINSTSDEVAAGAIFIHYKIVRASGLYRCSPPESN